jgi:hypothetical protein
MVVPEPIVFPSEIIDLDGEDGEYLSKEHIPQDDLREMLNEYLAFILSDSRVDELQRLFREFSQLPESLKDKLQSFTLGRNFLKEIDRVEAKDILIGARTLNRKGVKSFLPFIGFLNHNFLEGVAFNNDKDRVTVKGKPTKSGELFARYNRGDSFSFLRKYLFPDNSPFAYSKRVAFRLKNGLKLVVNRDILAQINSYYRQNRGGCWCLNHL